MAASRPSHQGHHARKRFGQNFLVDQGIIESIIAAIRPGPGDTLVEIGPGLGALTLPLLARLPAGTSLHVVELDRDLAQRLRQRPEAKHDQAVLADAVMPAAQAAATARLVVHEADALAFDFTALTKPDTRLRVCGNLPYNISSPLLFHLAGFANIIADQHFMLQKEVVERMVAAPGGKDYGRLSVMLQVRYAMELLFEVPPESFEPAPKVDSAVVRMIPLPQSLVPAGREAAFAQLVSQAFSQRRKMLRNTLRDHLPALEAAGIPPTARAEDLAAADYVRLLRLGEDSGAQ